MKKTLIILLTQLFAIIACAQNYDFSIHGKITGNVIYSKAYLRYFYKNSFIKDSAAVKAGVFDFKGKLPDKVILARVSICQYNQANASKENTSEIILVPGKIEMNADKHLVDAKFTGNKIEEEFSDYLNRSKSYREQLIAINYKYEKAQSENDLAELGTLDSALAKIHRAKQLIDGKFITDHPTSLVSAYKFDDFMGDEEIDLSVVEPVYTSLAPEIRNLPIMQQITERISIAKKTRMGEPAMDFAQGDTVGHMLSLLDFHGRYVLIDFWASWCVPCRTENPNLTKIYHEYHKKGLDILGVSLDAQKKEWINAIKTDSLQWPQVCDFKIMDNAAAKLYGITSIPQNILIGPD